jgi:flavodoxin/NAD-dependent dihydropyrimidine dehydrogenase PreA subunit
VKSVIIYFSQTGNTEKVAKKIQTGIKQVTDHCDAVEIREVNPLKLKEYDLIGIGSPVMGACPTNVLDFVSKIRFVGGKHAFAFCTHGTSSRFFFPSLYPKLKERGLIVVGYADWYADCYLLHMPLPYPTAGHLDEIDLSEAENFGRETAVRSMRIAAGDTSLIIPEPPPIPVRKPPAGVTDGPPPIIGQFSNMLKFYKEKCLYPGCTLCMDNCPTFGIDITVDPPILAKPCLDCEFCARICPTGALDMGEWVEGMIAMTGGNGDKMLAALEQAEKEGKFRRLIPIEKVKMNEPGWKNYKKHPQWIIGKGAQK